MRILLILALIQTTTLLSAQNIEESRYSVSFEISNTAFNTVEGTLKGMTGEVLFKKGNLSASVFDVCLDVSTINTNNDKRDEHLRQEDWFHVEKYPTICFKSERVTQSESKYKAVGKLTMHGITKEVEIPFKVDGQMLKGELTLIRQDYGVGGGSLLVGDEVALEIEFDLK